MKRKHEKKQKHMKNVMEIMSSRFYQHEDTVSAIENEVHVGDHKLIHTLKTTRHQVS